MDLHIHDADFSRYLMNGAPDDVVSRITSSVDGLIRGISEFTDYVNGVDGAKTATLTDAVCSAICKTTLIIKI